MIVLSAHGTTCNSERSLGSVATHTLVHAVLPVLVVQDLPAPTTTRDRREAWVAH
jgi:nucleotide-binding universal stress UspA family protein